MRKRTLHLHAGFHKTGTSAIQDYLYTHDIDPSFHYFDAGMPNSSLIMLQAFKSNLAENPQFRQDHLSESKASEVRLRAREKIFQIVSSINRSHTILSAESIGVLTPDELQDVLDFFNMHYDNILVYIYLRPIKSRIESAFQEALKTRFRGLDQKFLVVFESLIGKFDKVFGRDNVIVSKYSKDEFPGGDVVGHFLAQIGLDTFNVEPQGSVNSSLSLPAIQLLYIYRLYFPNRDRRDLERVRKLQQLSDDPFRFHSQLYGELVDLRDGDFDWLQNRVGFVLTEVIDADDAIGVREEADLTRVSDTALDWLKSQQRSIFSGDYSRLDHYDYTGACVRANFRN